MQLGIEVHELTTAIGQLAEQLVTDAPEQRALALAELVVVGYTPTHVVMNDAWGEPDLIHGTTLNANGMGLRFSRLNSGKRWMLEPIGGGAYRYSPSKGWAVVVDSIR